MHLFALLMHWYHPYTGVDLRYGMEINDFAVTVYHPHRGVALRIDYIYFYETSEQYHPITGAWI